MSPHAHPYPRRRRISRSSRKLRSFRPLFWSVVALVFAISIAELTKAQDITSGSGTHGVAVVMPDLQTPDAGAG